jgi:hypothetical protein
LETSFRENEVFLEGFCEKVGEEEMFVLED